MTPTRNCPRCGRPVEAGFRYCPDCGATVDRPATLPGPPPPAAVEARRDQTVTMVLLIALALLGLIGGVSLLAGDVAGSLETRVHWLGVAVVAFAVGVGGLVVVSSRGQRGTRVAAGAAVGTAAGVGLGGCLTVGLLIAALAALAPLAGLIFLVMVCATLGGVGK